MATTKKHCATRWGRVEQLAAETLLWMFIVGAAALVPAFTVRAFFAYRLRVPVDLDGVLSATSAATSAARTAGRFSLRPAEQAVLVVTDPTTADRIADVAPKVVLFAAMSLAAWLMLRLLVTLRTGEPFARSNLRRVQSLALTLFLAAHAWAIAGWLGRWHFHGATEGALGQGVSIQRWLYVPVWPVLTALALGAVAEFLRRGAVLRDDVDGLV